MQRLEECQRADLPSGELFSAWEYKLQFFGNVSAAGTEESTKEFCQLQESVRNTGLAHEKAMLMQRQVGTVMASGRDGRLDLDGIVVGDEGAEAGAGDPIQDAGVAAGRLIHLRGSGPAPP